MTQEPMLRSELKTKVDIKAITQSISSHTKLATTEF